MSARLDQLLGVVSLAAVDRLRGALHDAGGARGAVDEIEASALVHLQAWPGTSVNDLAGVVGRSQPATVRLVDRLVERGWAQREPGVDRRTLGLRLTARGGRLVDELLTARADALAPLLDALSARDAARLERLLHRVAAELADDRAGATRACRLCDRDACMTGPACPMEHTMAAGAPRPAPRR